MSLLLDTQFLSVSWEFILGVLGIILFVWILSKIFDRRK